jgi:hypothetical protein
MDVKGMDGWFGLMDGWMDGLELVQEVLGSRRLDVAGGVRFIQNSTLSSSI